MNHLASRRTLNSQVASLLAMAMFAVSSLTHAASTSDEESLEKGAVADVTPPQKYQTAIREAGGAYKDALRECDQTNGDERRSCTEEVKAVYDRDMAQAKLIFRGRELLQACARG